MRNVRAVMGTFLALGALGGTAAVGNAQAGGKPVTLLGGQWQITHHYDALVGESGKSTETFEQCMVPEFTDKDLLTAYLDNNWGEAAGCSFSAQTIAGGRVDVTQLCKASDGNMTVRQVGTFSGEQFDVTTSESMALPGAAPTIATRTRIVGRRTSATCSE